MLKAICAAVVLALTGCAAQTMETWLGHPETEVLASWGVPDRTAESGGRKFLTWDIRGGAGQIVCISTFVVGADGLVESYSTSCP